MEYKGFFVTGTDTGVGKTFISCALVKAWGACYWKPVQTGPVQDHDAPYVLRHGGIEKNRILDSVRCFDAPLSPNQAAQKQGALPVRLKHIHAPKNPPRPVVVAEGAGGLMVPLNEGESMLDLMVKLAWPVIVVARTQLGTLNHTLLTLAALKQAAVPVMGMILNGPLHQDNHRDLVHWSGVRVLAHVTQYDHVNEQVIDQVAALMPPLSSLFPSNFQEKSS